MAAPTSYNRYKNFANEQASSPSDPINGQYLDTELNRVKQSLDSIINNLAVIQRADTAIANASVGYDQLKDELNGFGFNPPSTWATSTNYIVYDTVFTGGGFYRCLVSHVSGTFSTDLTAEKWELIADFSAAPGSMGTATYDPGLVAGDVFDMDNMAEGTDTKILTAAERTKLGYVSVTGAVDLDTLSSGDMMASTYDPNTVEADVYDVDNHIDGTTNKVFSATEKTKLSNIEAAADVTDAANVNAAGAVMNTDTTTAAMSFVVDEDDMSSDSETKVPTQQSVKAYVDSNKVAAYGLFDGVGTPAWDFQSGFNSTITDNGAGDYAVTFSSALAGTNYVVQATVFNESGTAFAIVSVQDIAAAGFSINLINTSNIAVDRSVFVTVWDYN